MKTIWKFPLDVRSQHLSIPMGAKLLTAQLQGAAITLWALCDPAAALMSVEVVVVGTGWQVNVDGLTYIATVQQGAFVWHVFAKLP